MGSEVPILEMKSISKAFHGNTVLDNVDFTLHKGEIIGLIGENGAGKSTLMKILCGVYRKDAGTVFLDGQQVDFRNPDQARNAGISMIYQELSLFNDLNAVQNVFINKEVVAGNRLNGIRPLKDREMTDRAKHILQDMLGVKVDLKRPVADFSLAEKQMVEIGRSLFAQCKIIIMDEPTATLGGAEKNQLFQIMRELKKHGTGIVFVSHHLDEIMEVCDKAVILRDGKLIADCPTADLTMEEMISMMIGQSVSNMYPKETVPIGDTVLEVEGLTKQKAYQDISFNLRKGEILGLAGLADSGKHQLIRSMFGIIRADGGSVKIRGKKTRIRKIRQAMNYGFAFLPADRKVEAGFTEQSVRWNVSIAAMDQFSGKAGLSNKKEHQLVEEYVRLLGVKMRSQTELLKYLSGGNQQKVIFARWMLRKPEILFLEEPTRGIDINAKTEIYKMIMGFVRQGNSVVFVSTDEEELVGICDRIMVMRQGKKVLELDAASTSVEEIKYYSNTSEA